MLIWFAVLAPVSVALVFKSPMLDYRLVAAGALLPLLEFAYGRPAIAHTLLFSVGAMAVVMGITTKRRLLRRRLLGVPIGLMVHQVLDGSWTSKELFWWPAFGVEFPPTELPAFSRSLEFGLLLEVVAIGVGIWAYKRFELDAAANRDLLARHGQLSRAVLQ